MIIYAIHNLVNGKLYIGQTVAFPEQRWRKHRNKLNNGTHENEKLQRAWNKYGEASFTFYIVSVCRTRQELNEYEQKLIQSTNSIQNGYNIQAGGESRSHSDTTRKKLSRLAKRRFERLSEAEKERQRSHIVNAGRNRSAEATRRMASTLRRKYQDPEYKEKWRKTQLAKWEGFVSPEGKKITITDLPTFCREHQLQESCMIRVYYGERRSHNGWTHPSNPLRIKQGSTTV